MADVNANIGVNIDSSAALAQLKALQRQISQFHTSVAKSSESASLAQRNLQKNFLNSINAIGAFSAELRTVKTTAETFTTSLEKNKFSMREYFRYAGASTKTFGRLFKTEFDTIEKVATERVKRLQTQYIKLGRDTNGVMQAIAVMPKDLNMNDFATKTAMAAQKQALFNQLVKQGSTNLLNFGKNTQWAGRQLMVGFTLPLMALGTSATKAFMDMEAQAIRFKKVYGDLFTTPEETQQALDGINALAKGFTRYGIAASQTVGLAAEAAAAGFKGVDLQAQTNEATRLSVLGQIDAQQALQTTISLQNAFNISSSDLANTIDFLNAVENQTVVSLDDITTAIPKVAPVIQQLGGSVKDLAFFLAAMKEGGVNASEGANALKSGLAALINPTKKASATLLTAGINIKQIIDSNAGNLKGIVLDFAKALDTLNPVDRARAIEMMFGKFQFARLSTLFANVAKTGTQASRVLDLATASAEDLANVSQKELGITSESAMMKFKKAVEDLKLALVPVGQTFLDAVTPIINFVNDMLDKFNNLSTGTKKAITLITVAIGAIGPVALMTFGLLANGIANIIKLFLTLRGGYQRLTGASQNLDEQTQYLTTEQLDAAAAAASLDQAHARLTQQFTVEADAVLALKSAYDQALGSAQRFAMTNPGMMLPPRGRKKMATGGMVPGSGNRDTVPAMLTPGEAVIPKEQTKKYGALIQGIISNNIPGYRKGTIGSGYSGRIGKSATTVVRPYGANVSNTGGLVGFGDIDPSNTSDIISIYTKEILSQAKVTLSAVNQEISTWQTTNSAAIDAATTAVNQGANAADTYADLMTKFATDMQQANGPFAKFMATAEQIMPQLAQDLIEAQAKAKELGLNIKNAADAVKLSEVLPNNIVAQSAAKPGPFGSMSKVRSAAVAAKGGVSGISQFGIPRFMVTPNIEPSSIAYRAATSQEHFSTTRIQEANLATQAKLREQARQNPSLLVAAEQQGRAEQQAYEKGRKSVAQDAYIVGRDRKSPHPQAQIDGRDDGTAYSTAVEKSIARHERKLSKVSRGVGVGQTISAAVDQENAKRKTSMERLDGMNRALMTGTFALTAFSSLASFSSGSIGDLSGTIAKFSGIMFGLMSVTQLLTQAKIAELAATRLASAKQAAAFASYGSGLAGRAGLLGKIAQLGVGITRFLGPIGIGVGVLTAGIAIYKAVNAAKERERLAIEAFGNALNLTTDQIKKFGDIYGFTPTKSPLESAKIGTGVIAKTSGQQERVAQVKEMFKNDKGMQQNISELQKATDAQAGLMLRSIGMRLLSSGASADAVKEITMALQEEAGKTDLKIDFKAIDLGSPEGQKTLQDSADKLVKSFNKRYSSGIIKGTKLVLNEQGHWIQVADNKMTKSLAKNVDTTANAFSNFLVSLSGQFSKGIININEFNTSFDGLSKTIATLEAPQQLALMSAIIKTLPEDVATATAKLGDFASQMLVIKAASVGVAVTAKIIDALAIIENPNADYASLMDALATRKKFIEDIAAMQKDIVKATTAGTGILGDTGSTKKVKTLQDLIKENRANVQTINDQTVATRKLVAAKFTAAEASQLVANAEDAAAIAGLKVKYTKKQWEEYIKTLRQARSALLGTVQGAKQALDEATSKANEYFDAQAALIQLQRKAGADAIQSRIDSAQAQVDNANAAIDVQQKALDANNHSIDLLNRRIDINYDRPIQALSDETNILNNNMAIIDHQAQSINEQFDAQAKALDQVAQANQQILDQEKSRLSIAGALTTGDIAAAAQAAQEARAQAAATQAGATQSALDAARQSALAGLTAGGMTKAQIEERTYQIGQQTFLLEQQRKVLQDQVVALQDKNYLIEQAIYNIKVTQLDPAQIALDTANKSLETYNKQTDSLISQLNYLNMNKEQWDANKIKIDAAYTSIQMTETSLKNAKTAAQTLLDNWNQIKSKTITLTVNKGGNGLGLGSLFGFSRGGFVPQYLASGGFSRGTDTVPAMLTPGEFVVNKNASQRFAPLLSSINETKYPSMSKLGLGGGTFISSSPTSVNNSSSSVYNYNLGITVGGSNIDPRDVARVVIGEIKQLDAQRIRKQKA